MVSAAGGVSPPLPFLSAHAQAWPAGEKGGPGRRPDIAQLRGTFREGWPTSAETKVAACGNSGPALERPAARPYTVCAARGAVQRLNRGGRQLTAG